MRLSRRKKQPDEKPKTELQEFFERNIGRVEYCENCGTRLRGHICELAHILPKSFFKSVATNDDNLVFLCCEFIGGEGCHGNYDHTWARAKTMKVWAVAKERYELFKDKIAEKNYKILQHFES